MYCVLVGNYVSETLAFDVEMRHSQGDCVLMCVLGRLAIQRLPFRVQRHGGTICAYG